MIVRLPPPTSHPRSSTNRRVTPPESQNTNSPSIITVSQISTNPSPIPSTEDSRNLRRVPASTQVSVPVTVHRSQQQPTVPGNYRTAKFLEMSNLEASKQHISSSGPSSSQVFANLTC